MFTRLAGFVFLSAMLFSMLPMSASAQCVTDFDGDGYISAACPGGNDCDDNDPTVHPFAPEVVGDGIDQDCDGHDACYEDLDGDGYGSPVVVPSPGFICAGQNGVSILPGDCNDASSSIHPGAIDIPDNGIDENCDGVDETAVALRPSTWSALRALFR